ncbi:glutamate--tRNA ligase [bacterium]|nr:MAG: glutamate--tRNA ligase [bacterium]
MPIKPDQSEKKLIRVRIAPSPTGLFHIGTARAALFNFLFAKKHEGSFILRIEDTDKKRSQRYFEQDIIDGLDWLGLKRDEGPVVGGKYGPYRQSERIEIYKKYLKQLLEEDKAFYCFCKKSETDLLITKRSVHWCKCGDLSDKEIKEKISNGESFVIRFKTPRKKEIVFKDLIRGRVKFDTEIIGNFSIAKNLDEPLYNFAAVVDDYEMRISHVIRGEDHISNTPKQLLLAQALGFSSPSYAHLALILGPDKTKLSKRHNTVSLKDYKENGYLSEAMINFMALLGWNPGTNQEIFSLSELIENFSLKRAQLSGAIFDLNKLEWINGYYIRNFPEKKYLEMALKYLKGHNENKEYLTKVSMVSRKRLKKLSDLERDTNFFFNEPQYEQTLLCWKQMTKEDIKESLKESLKTFNDLSDIQFKKDNLELILLKKAQEFNKDRGCLLWPLRVALTGLNASPSPFDVAAILGKKESIKRIKKAISKANNE